MSRRRKEKEQEVLAVKTVSRLTLEETETAIWKIRSEIGSLNYIYTDSAEEALIKEYLSMEYQKENLKYELDRINIALAQMSAEEVVAAYPEATKRIKEIQDEIRALDKIFNSCKGNAKTYAAKQLDKLMDRQCQLKNLLEGLRDHKSRLNQKKTESGVTDHSGFDFHIRRQIDLNGFISCVGPF